MRYIFFVCLALSFHTLSAQSTRARDFGIRIGVMATGKLNAITDVPGVLVGQTTLIKADSIRTGVTAIIPHAGNIFQQKVPAAIYVGNGFWEIIRCHASKGTG